jgi:nucleotide-binding universal stress UspA family protein
MFTKALVGVDISPAETSLLSCLPDLVRWGIESVVLAHVIQIGYGQGRVTVMRTTIAPGWNARAEPLRAAGLTVSVSVTASGVPADELLAAARAEGADLVVVGSRSHNFLYEIFLGSVAKEVIRKSDMPVLIERLEPMQAGHAETCAAICSQALDKDSACGRSVSAIEIGRGCRGASGSQGRAHRLPDRTGERCQRG